MFEVKAVSHFCAAHYLVEYKGKCESLHGHNWQVEAVIRSKRLDHRGIVIDFKDLKKLLNEILSGLDHKLLNDLSFFHKRNTTSEIIAQFIFAELKKKLAEFLGPRKARIIKLKEVAVWEQENSCAIYRETQKCA